MKLLIHGNDLEKTREFYYAKKTSVQNPVFLNGEGLNFDTFFQAAENNSLFEINQTILIENLFSKNKITSVEIKKILTYVNAKKQIDLIIWEQAEISKTALSQIKDFEVSIFMIPQKMFNFLDQIRPNNSKDLIRLFHEIKINQEPEMIMFMLIRQFRLLQSVNQISQIDEVKKMAPWQASKLKNQAGYFSKEQLIVAYNKLFEIERKQKTGKIPAATLDTSIDFFLSGL